jgi:hypothetical protein
MNDETYVAEITFHELENACTQDSRLVAVIFHSHLIFRLSNTKGKALTVSAVADMPDICPNNSPTKRKGKVWKTLVTEAAIAIVSDRYLRSFAQGDS